MLESIQEPQSDVAQSGKDSPQDCEAVRNERCPFGQVMRPYGHDFARIDGARRVCFPEVNLAGVRGMVRVIATVEFTEDMAETLRTYFAAYQQGGVVKVEVSDHGLWLRHPHSGTRQFLGSPVVMERDLVAPVLSFRRPKLFERSN
jgi:hypothetical protein